MPDMVYKTFAILMRGGINTGIYRVDVVDGEDGLWAVLEWSGDQPSIRVALNRRRWQDMGNGEGVYSDPILWPEEPIGAG